MTILVIIKASWKRGYLDGILSMNMSAGGDGRNRMRKSVEMVSYGMHVEVIEGLMEVRPYSVVNKEPFLVRENMTRE